jgi:hypothetical protein
MSFSRDHRRVKNKQSTQSKSIFSSMMIAPTIFSPKIETIIEDTTGKAQEENFMNRKKHHKNHRHSQTALI